MRIFYTIIAFLFYLNIAAQVGINNTDPKASLDISADTPASPKNTDGLLIPRLDALPATSPTDDQHGMIIYLATPSGGYAAGFLYWNKNLGASGQWASLGGDGGGWKLDGNSIVDGDFLGTTNDKPLIFKANGNKRFSITQKGQLEVFEDGNSIFIGENAGENDNQGSNNQNVFIGHEAGRDNVSGSQNVALGYNALLSNQSASSNIAIGNNALKNAVGSILSGGNTAIGRNAGQTLSNGGGNTIIGNLADVINGNEERATIIGVQAKGGNSSIVSIGTQAEATGEDAVGIGRNANASETSAVAIGSFTNAEGEGAIAIGETAISQYSNTVALGNSSRANGGGATALGSEANATGINSVALGKLAKTETTGSISIGYNSDAGSGLFNQNAIAIGSNASATGSSATAIGTGSNAPNGNTVILGNSFAKVGIGTDDPQEKLQVNGSFRYVDTNQGAGKVLTSDANGTATWQTIPSATSNKESSNKEYGELYFNADQTVQLTQDTNVPLPSNGVSGLSSANTNVASNGITPTVSGVFKVTYTVTYKRQGALNSTINNIEFYLTENTNKIANTSTVSEITDEKIHSFTTSKILSLTANQTYFIGISKIGANGSGAPEIKILHDATNIIVESF